MEHSIALVTGATSGLGYAAARLLAGEGWSEIIVTGRTLASAQKAAAQLAADTKKQVFTPLELNLDKPSSVQSALAELVKRGWPIDFLLLNAGIVPGKKGVLTAAGVEAITLKKGKVFLSEPSKPSPSDDWKIGKRSGKTIRSEAKTRPVCRLQIKEPQRGPGEIVEIEIVVWGRVLGRLKTFNHTILATTDYGNSSMTEF